MDLAQRLGSNYVDEQHKPVPSVKGTADEVFGQSSPIYFKTYERPMYYRGNLGREYQVPGKKAVIRIVDDKPHVIGVVGKNYKVISTEDVCKSVEDTFRKTLDDSELSVVQRRDRMAYNGGQCIRDYVFPNLCSRVGRYSHVAFRTVIVNGYDGTSSFKLYNGGIDFFCENRLVTGSFDMSIHRHTQGFTIPNIIDRVRGNIDVFYKQSEIWAGWSGKEITDEDARSCFESIPGISERRVDQLIRRFHMECSSHGRTVWAMYSAATFFASQTKGEFRVRDNGNDHTEATLMKREQAINLWTKTDKFARIAT
jgi:hypothetical protein